MLGCVVAGGSGAEVGVAGGGAAVDAVVAQSTHKIFVMPIKAFNQRTSWASTKEMGGRLLKWPAKPLSLQRQVSKAMTDQDQKARGRGGGTHNIITSTTDGGSGDFFFFLSSFFLQEGRADNGIRSAFEVIFVPS